MAKKSRKNIMFTTSRQSSSGEIKKFAAVLIACVVGILAISCLAILKKYNFDIKSALGGNAETEVSTEVEQSAEIQINADKTYLLWCADDEGTRLRFAWLVNIKLPERKASVHTLSSDLVVDFEGGSESLNDIYVKSGKNKLVSALETHVGFDIDGYIGSGDDSFKAMINYFGGMEITVPEQIEYRGSDFTLILVRGKQNLKGDTMFKYLRYLDTLGSRGRSLQASVVLEMLDYVFKPAYLERRSSIFSRLSNTLETDLSIVDFSSSEEGIKILMEKGLSVKKTAETPEELKGKED